MCEDWGRRMTESHMVRWEGLWTCVYVVNTRAPGSHVSEMNERGHLSLLTSLPSISSFSGNFGQSKMWPVGTTERSFRIMGT